MMLLAETGQAERAAFAPQIIVQRREALRMDAPRSQHIAVRLRFQLQLIARADA
jgi:c-di-GMP-binding flagellar brake protein YcgR